MSVSLFEHLERVFVPTTIEAVWTQHCEKMAEYGFDRLFYGYTRFRTNHSLGNADDGILLSNHPQSYLEHYLGQGLYKHAPMVDWVTENVGACSLRLLADRVKAGPVSDMQERLFALNRRFDVVAGYAISFRDLSIRSKGAIGLCARVGLSQDDVDAIWQRSGREIVLINNLFHLRITSLPYASPVRSLTARQREALEWVGDGKTIQDIAILMGLTTATVEKHLRLARESLAVETTAQAVLKASFQNQIFVDRQ